MRGERNERHYFHTSASGSSPHARGTRVGRHLGDGHNRIIPACAGNAAHGPAGSTAGADHPRMRGERDPHDAANKSTSGSSPHARGTLFCTDNPPNLVRIIPACAGNASRRRWATVARADHPRMRGERACRARPAPPTAGSSPHARGTQRGPFSRKPDDRIIPACAGNASSCRGSAVPHTDHPRMRGERRLRGYVAFVARGSSPHARGTHRPIGNVPQQRRIIPACAGNAATGPAVDVTRPDHPRMRGERHCRVSVGHTKNGSSPHARGTRSRRLRRWRFPRIIPGCAGNAILAASSAAFSSDHPRMRWERYAQSARLSH